MLSVPKQIKRRQKVEITEVGEVGVGGFECHHIHYGENPKKKILELEKKLRDFPSSSLWYWEPLYYGNKNWIHEFATFHIEPKVFSKETNQRKQSYKKQLSLDIGCHKVWSAVQFSSSNPGRARKNIFNESTYVF